MPHPFELRKISHMTKNASTHIFYDHSLKYHVRMCRKITKIVATRCQILRLKYTKFDFGWGSAPDQMDLRGPTSNGREGRGKRGRNGGEGKGCPLLNS